MRTARSLCCGGEGADVTQPPGWYRVPADGGLDHAWWDGTRWTGEVWRPPAVPLTGGGSAQELAASGGDAPSRRSHRIDAALVAFTLTATALFAWHFTTSLDEKALREHRATTFVELPVNEPGGAFAAMPLDAAEEYAASYVSRRDADGSYVESSQAIAAAFGATVRWDAEADSATRCQRTEPGGSDEWTVRVAFFCSIEPYIVYLDSDSPAMPALLYEPDLVDTVKHELAHHAILLRCGQKDYWEVPEEGVTNSYAVLYLGADKRHLTEGLPSDHEYGVTAATDDLAERVHSGDCA